MYFVEAYKGFSIWQHEDGGFVGWIVGHENETNEWDTVEQVRAEIDQLEVVF